jgi:hypothetical protein
VGTLCGSGFKPRLGPRDENRGWKPLPRLNLTALEYAADVPRAAAGTATGNPDRRLPRAEPLQGFAQQAARQQLAPQAPVRARADAVRWLAAAVDVKRGSQGVRLALRGAEKGQRAELQLHVKLLRNWLNILHDTYCKAAWPLDVWPDWVREAAAPRATLVRH